METILEQVKLLLDLTTDGGVDPLLNLYTKMAMEEIRDYCGEFSEVPETLVAQMVVIKYQRRGTESLANSNYAGNGEVYLGDYPNYILRRLDDLKSKSKRRLRTL